MVKCVTIHGYFHGFRSAKFSITVLEVVMMSVRRGIGVTVDVGGRGLCEIERDVSGCWILQI